MTDQNDQELPRRLALAEIHLDLLFVRNASGLLLQSRDSEVRAPLLHVVRTPEGNRWYLGEALPQRLRDDLDAALRRAPAIDDGRLIAGDLSPPSDVLRLLMNFHQELNESRGPAFDFPEALPAAGLATEILTEPHATASVAELAWLRDATADARPFAVARNERGEVVAVCHSARSTASAAEAGVETASTYRGRGFAGAVVSRWAEAVRAEGRVPIYSTQWTNHASRAVARKLGLVAFGEDYSIG